MEFKRLPKEAEDYLAMLAKEGDLDAIEKLASSLHGYIYFLAKKYFQTPNADIQDFIQEGYKCLIGKVLRNFDPRKSSIITYGGILIYQDMVALYNKSSVIPSPSGRNKVWVDFFNDLFVSDDDSDDFSPDRHPAYRDINALDPDILVMARDELDEFKEIYIQMMIALKKTSKRNQDIFCFLYGLDDCLEQRTLEEAGEKFGISRERVRQLIDNVWRRMPKKIAKGKEWFEDKIKRILCISEFLHIDVGELLHFLSNSNDEQI